MRTTQDLIAILKALNCANNSYFITGAAWEDRNGTELAISLDRNTPLREQMAFDAKVKSLNFEMIMNATLTSKGVHYILGVGEFKSTLDE